MSGNEAWNRNVIVILFTYPVLFNRQRLSNDGVWGIRGEMIRTAPCCVVYDS